MADERKRPRPSLGRRVRELVPGGDGTKRPRGRPPLRPRDEPPPAALGKDPSSSPGSPAPPIAGPAPVPPTPWKPVAVQIAAQLDPIYDALCGGWHPSEEQWEHFTMAWGAVVDHYAPLVGGSIWTPAVTATVLMGWPLVAGYLALKRAKAEAEANAEPARSGEGRKGGSDEKAA
jgi:hypothetical protein